MLDNSLSTGAVRDGGAALDELQSAAKHVLDAATPDDRVWVLTVDGQVTAGDASAARGAVGRAQPIGGAGDLVGAIERAVALTRSSALDRGDRSSCSPTRRHPNGRAPRVSARCR